jgi:hypothetical protein
MNGLYILSLVAGINAAAALNRYGLGIFPTALIFLSAACAVAGQFLSGHAQ